MDNDFDDFDLLNFLKIDSESESESDTECATPYNNPPTLMGRKICEVNDLQIKKNLSYEATSEIVKLMNGMPNTTVQLPKG